ncbi:MAG: aminoacetone oxidase family FAD-binding enzyme [Micavibrio sp. TMED27]|nr:aminoacetone oxidase family FAD-binding enzyme [Micavibrio sp.]OUT92447.1 MAG: aminoacetone oxidase family FAD-binding enzyme [Micavibrio sp. TMED27]
MGKAGAQKYDAVIIGAGAAGLMCAATAGYNGRRVCLIDHAKKLAEKIRISGGGRCNFTNINTSPENYISKNPHFCKSALKSYTQHDFIKMVEDHNIAYHEKTLGQLFCDESAQEIIDMLRQRCIDGGVDIKMETSVESINRMNDQSFLLQTSAGDIFCDSLVIASGGLSIPKIGATKFGYSIAEQFKIPMVAPRPGLVPLTFSKELLDDTKEFSGISLEASVSTHDKKISFREGMLFTHKGLSGPSILQISSYWREGEEIILNLLPDHNIEKLLKSFKGSSPKRDIKAVLSDFIPARIADYICERCCASGKMAEISHKRIEQIAQHIHNWRIKPNGSEGYKKAEVTIGGVDTNALSSKTMEARDHKGLYFIGEVVDVTGHLGGYNFQWAWSSGYAAAMAI